jgi:hypothetical protein
MWLVQEKAVLLTSASQSQEREKWERNLDNEKKVTVSETIHLPGLRDFWLFFFFVLGFELRALCKLGLS